MSESLEVEIRTLQSIFWSERDPDGLAFAPLADAFRRKGDVREALDLLVDGTARHPGYATGHVVTTRLYLEQGMFERATTFSGSSSSARRAANSASANIPCSRYSRVVTTWHVA